MKKNFLHPFSHFIFLSFTCLFFIFSNTSVQAQASKKAIKKYNEAVFQFKSMEYTKALELADDAIKIDENYADAYLLKGDILKILKRYDEAEIALNKAIEINPTDKWIVMSKAEMQFQTNNYAGAEKSLIQFLTYKNIPKNYIAIANQMLKNSTFAKEAIKNPVIFQPINLGPNINTAVMEYFPGLTADEEYLYFTRNDHQEDFYYSTLKNGKWQLAKSLGAPVNTSLNEGFVSVTSDGQYIFFTACNREEGMGSCDLYFTKFKGEVWSKPINMQSPVNTAAWESQPSVSFDGKRIYFSSNRPGGYGGKDIWYTAFENNRFTAPVNLGPTINTEGDEQTPFIHQDGKTLYFSSTGLPGFGAGDLFYTKLNEDNSWQTPVNLGYPINTFADEFGLIVNRKGDKAYFSSDMPGGFGSVDIYQFDLPENLKPEPVSYVKGIVTDAETGEKLQANVELFDIETQKTIITTTAAEKSGQFLVILQPNHDYGLNVEMNGYLFHSENFSLIMSPSNEPFLLEIKLNKLKPGNKVVLKNTFFDVNSFNLKPESFSELDKLIKLLKEQATMRIEIGGHTDNTGDKSKNLLLSQNRAKSVYDYLVKNGIEKSRLTYKGYGDNKPIADNNTEEGKQQNRRTEITIIN